MISKKEPKFALGDKVYITNSSIFEGKTREEINTSYKIIDIVEDLCDDMYVQSLEVEGPFRPYVITNLDVELDKGKNVSCCQPTKTNCSTPTQSIIKKENSVENPNKYQTVSKDMLKIFEIFEASEGAIKPHFALTGPSGSGKTYTIKTICDQMNFNYVEVNAAGLTKEGTSGNSLSKALSPLLNQEKELTVVFVDEFDKLFISGNSNSQTAHETTNGVQNEFLKVLEGDNTQVFGDYGKYVAANTDKCLFIFAGAFNGEENITLDRLRDFGVKTEFLGRVGLIYNMKKLSLEALIQMVDENNLLQTYLTLYKNVKKEDVVTPIKEFITLSYENNTIGARLINTLVSQYFIRGGKLGFEDEKLTFKKSLEL